MQLNEEENNKQFLEAESAFATAMKSTTEEVT